VFETLDFERYWLDKFSACLDELAGETVRRTVMAGSEGLSDVSPREEVIAWSRKAMVRLAALADEATCRSVMTSCACQYPTDNLREVRQVYESTGDLDKVLQMLQDRFETFLADTLHLDAATIREIALRGWGLAGRRQGMHTVVAIKIPKSGFLVEYMQESNPEVRRQYYCHCPRVRDALRSGQDLPAHYCYCGAGYYKGIWQEIVQQPVEVEVLESVLQGGDVCRIAVHLPAQPSTAES
jgi:predicted hydrocarbon binding protein